MKISEALNEFEKVLMNTYKSDGCVTSAITEIHKNIILSAIYKEIENIDIEQIVVKVINTTEMWTRSAMKGTATQNELYDAEQKIKHQAITDFKTNLEEIR